MVCTTLNVVDPVIHPSVSIEKFGFAEVEFTNRFFETPCEEAEIIGYCEAVGLRFTVKDADAHPYANIQFTVNYYRPGETSKTSWSANFTLASGTHERFIYHTDLKYVKGEYSGLTVGTVILK